MAGFLKIVRNTLTINIKIPPQMNKSPAARGDAKRRRTTTTIQMHKIGFFLHRYFTIFLALFIFTFMPSPPLTLLYYAAPYQSSIRKRECSAPSNQSLLSNCCLNQFNKKNPLLIGMGSLDGFSMFGHFLYGLHVTTHIVAYYFHVINTVH